MSWMWGHGSLVLCPRIFAHRLHTYFSPLKPIRRSLEQAASEPINSALPRLTENMSWYGGMWKLGVNTWVWNIFNHKICSSTQLGSESVNFFSVLIFLLDSFLINPTGRCKLSIRNVVEGLERTLKFIRVQERLEIREKLVPLISKMQSGFDMLGLTFN